MSVDTKYLRLIVHYDELSDADRVRIELAAEELDTLRERVQEAEKAMRQHLHSTRATCDYEGAAQDLKGYFSRYGVSYG